MLYKFKNVLSLPLLLLASLAVPHAAFSAPTSDAMSDSPSESLPPHPSNGHPDPLPSMSPSSQIQFNRLADVEVKSICSFLDQSSINSLLRSSRTCLAAVNANERTGLDTFKRDRKDTLVLNDPKQLKLFLDQVELGALNHLYAGGLEITIQGEEELNRLLKNEKLQKTLTTLTLNFKYLFVAKGPNESLVELLGPFKRLTSIRVINYSGHESTAAFEMIKNNDIDAFRELITREPIQLIIRNKNNQTPAQFAVQHDKWEIVKLLAQYAPETLKSRNIFGTTPIHWAAKKRMWDVLNVIIEYLPKALTIQDDDGDTPFHIVATRAPLEVIKSLIQRAPQAFQILKMQNHSGSTPAHSAVYYYNWEFLKFLAQHHPECLVTKNSRGSTPAHLASMMHPTWKDVNFLTLNMPEGVPKGP